MPLLKYKPSGLSRLEEYEREEKLRGERSLRRAQWVQTLTFLGVMLVFGVLSLTLTKPEESEIEKRKLATMPEFSADALIEGSYVQDLELHYSDTFPLREKFVSLASLINELRGVRFDSVRIYSQAPQQPAQDIQPPEPASPRPEPPPYSSSVPPSSGQEESQPEESPEPRQPHTVVDDGAIGEQSGSVFVYKERAMSMFGGSDGMAEWYAETINAYGDAWEGKAKVYNMVIPIAIEFALPERYQSVTSPQRPNIDHITESLNGNVVPVDAYSALEAHADEYVYFNSDHHWTGLGAYYAYTAFAESAGFAPLALEDYRKGTIAGFQGTMYSYTTDATLKEDYVDYYIPPTEYSAVRFDKGTPYYPVPHTAWAEYAQGVNSYSVFLAGDFPLVQIDTEVKNGRKALVVKESFGNAFAPLLIPHYEQVFVVDQRYFQLGLVDFVNENGVDDVIFINNVQAANTGIRIEEIERIMYQTFTPPAPVESAPEQEEPSSPEADAA